MYSLIFVGRGIHLWVTTNEGPIKLCKKIIGKPLKDNNPICVLLAVVTIFGMCDVKGSYVTMYLAVWCSHVSAGLFGNELHFQLTVRATIMVEKPGSRTSW